MVMVMVWKQQIITTVIFLVFFGLMELLYISASFSKVPEGGWIPLSLSLIFLTVMYVWNYGTLKKHQFDAENKVSMKRILRLGPSLGMVRVPGIGLIYTNLVTGVPAVFGHFVTNLPAFHQVLVFVCVKSVQVPYVCEKERFLISRVGQKEHSMFRCIVRYGYKNLQQENYDFENTLVAELVQFVEKERENGLETMIEESSREFGSSDIEHLDNAPLQTFTNPSYQQYTVRSSHDIQVMKSGNSEQHLENPRPKEESLQIMKAKESGVAYILGHSNAKAKKSSSIVKKVAIDFVYAFLSRNCRGPDVVLNVPHTSLLEVGMIYYV